MDMAIQMTPVWELKLDQIQKIKEYSSRVFIARGIALGILPSEHEGRQGIRPLQAADFGLLRWATPALLKDSPTIWIDFTVPAGKIIILYKIVQLELKPAVINLGIEAWGKSMTISLETLHSILPILEKLKEIEDIDQLELEFGSLDRLRMEGYFLTPIFFNPYDHLTIRVTASRDSPGERLLLAGYII